MGQVLVQAQARVLGLGLGLAQDQGQVQLLRQDQVLGQAPPVQGQKQVHMQVRMQGLGLDQDLEAIDGRALVVDAVRVMVRVQAEEVALVKVLVTVKVAATARDMGVDMENEFTYFSLGWKR